MQRLMYKLLTKTPQKPLYSPSPSPSKNGFFTHYTTFPHSKNALITQPNNFSNGVLSNSPFVKHFLTNILSKCQNKGVYRTLYGDVKALFSTRSFHSLNSYNRGWRSGSQRLTSDGVIWTLILSNVAVFMLWRVADRSFMTKNFMISIDNLKNGRIHTLITHAFSHMDMSHLFSNMLGLYFFGTSIGRNFGPKYLLKLYLAGAVVGAVFHLGYHALTSPFSGFWFFGIGS
ncbi:hypothetical protein Leryth_001321 [Lithospermum erythrorhizon]|nr:hypothetical protein Leryth_001321 [Lithospermum erythrorhizon]